MIATFFNADGHKIEYVKGAGEAEGKWLRVTTNGPASHVEPEVRALYSVELRLPDVE